MRSFYDLLRQETHLSIHIIGMELNLIGLLNDAIRVSGLSVEDGDTVKLNAVSQVDAVFSHG
jgi:hypothetical protein